MDLAPDEEQVALVRASRALLEREMPRERLHDIAGGAPSVDPALWRRCAELGWFGLGLHDSYGGVGATVAEEVLLFREVGRALAPGPLLPTVLGARLAAMAGDVALAGGIVAGDVVVGLVAPLVAPITGEPAAGQVRLVDAASADLVLALTPERAALYPVPASSEPVPCVDDSVPLARACLAGLAPAAALADAAGAADLTDLALVLVAAQLAGIAEATLEMSVGYAKLREQFGRPIGSFQTIKHRCADMAVRAEAASSTALFAGLALAEGLPAARFHVLAARSVAGRSARANAADNVQNHGGIGVTFEHDAHWFVKRTHVLTEAFGATRQVLARLLAEPAP